MIDPYDLTKGWNLKRVQEWFLFGVCVAGKNARQTANKVERLLTLIRQRMGGKTRQTPFNLIQFAIDNKFLLKVLQETRMGQYGRIEKAFAGMVKVDAATVALEELEQIHGVGAKTARMLLLYTRPDQEMIPLDTHVLHWMRDNGYNAPKSTPPPGKKYRELELAFIAEGRKRGLTAKEWDTQVWQQYAKR